LELEDHLRSIFWQARQVRTWDIQLFENARLVRLPHISCASFYFILLCCVCVWFRQLIALQANVQRIRANQDKLQDVLRTIKDSQQELTVMLQELGTRTSLIPLSLSLSLSLSLDLMEAACVDVIIIDRSCC
jgi:hypothetical protein